MRLVGMLKLFFNKFLALHKAGARATMEKSKKFSMSMISYNFLKETL
jgi:hypothetical protein